MMFTSSLLLEFKTQIINETFSAEMIEFTIKIRSKSAVWLIGFEEDKLHGSKLHQVNNLQAPLLAHGY